MLLILVDLDWPGRAWTQRAAWRSRLKEIVDDVVIEEKLIEKWRRSCRRRWRGAALPLMAMLELSWWRLLGNTEVQDDALKTRGMLGVVEEVSNWC